MRENASKESEKLSKSFHKLQIRADKFLEEDSQKVPNYQTHICASSVSESCGGKRYSEVIPSHSPQQEEASSARDPSLKFAAQTIRTISKKSFGSVLRRVNRTKGNASKGASQQQVTAATNAEVTLVGKRDYNQSTSMEDQLSVAGQRRYNGLGIFDRPGFGR